MLLKLPHWVLVSKFPAVNDCESLTVIEQTARIYGKINELIESYNKYVESVNKLISDYQDEKTKEVECFLHNLEILTENYINTVDMKISHQDRAIAEVYEKFSEDVLTTLKLKINEFKENGQLDNAILESFDNINGKIEKFIADCETFKKDMTADYNALKSNLNNDYQNTKEALAREYDSTKKDLVNHFYEEKENLQSDYQETKSALDSDYQETKSALDSDYQETKSALESSVDGYTDMYENKEKQLFIQPADGDGTGMGYFPDGVVGDFKVNDIDKYNIVYVEFNNATRIICTVDKTNTSKIVIRGFETEDLLDDNGYSFIGVCIVVDKQTFSCLENKSTTMKFSVSGTVTLSHKNHNEKVTGIIGII